MEQLGTVCVFRITTSFLSHGREFPSHFDSFGSFSMKRHTVVFAVFVAASMLASEAAVALPLAPSLSVNAFFGKTKLVNFNLRNDSAVPLKLRCGESVMTVEAGKTMDLHLPVGARVVTEEASASHPSGTIIAEVSSQLSGVTISVK